MALSVKIAAGPATSHPERTRRGHDLNHAPFAALRVTRAGENSYRYRLAADYPHAYCTLMIFPVDGTPFRFRMNRM
jgi:hypothetical protein